MDIVTAALRAVTSAALVLAAEAAAVLKADDANGGDGDGGVAVISCASLSEGGSLTVDLLSTL